MKKRHLLTIPSFLAICLSSCGFQHYEPKDYIVKEIEYKENYRILQLTDTHLGDKSNVPMHLKFMDLTIQDANPDLIVITGDVLTLASKGTALELFKFLDSYGVDWTIVFGNHDEQCYFSIDWLTGTLNNYSHHCLFKDIQDDDIHGNSNFAVNITKEGQLFEQLIFMDSNRYYFGDYFGYDYFKQNQIDWYSDLIDYTTKQNGGNVVPSLMFYHIPLPEVNNAWNYALEHEEAIIYSDGVKNEKSCNPDRDLSFFDVIKAKGSTTGMYFGHDHINNFIVNYENIHFGYGIKATDIVYYDEGLLGGRVIVLKNDNTVEYEHIYHTYEEVK